MVCNLKRGRGFLPSLFKFILISREIPVAINILLFIFLFDMGIDALLEEIRSRLDIVDVISRYVDLRKRGKNFVGLCPFHVEKTPSFTVSPDKQFFYCFGCGIGGDVIKFLMMIENLEFKEALEKACELAGIEYSFSEPQDFKQGNKLKELHALLAGWFSKFLKSDSGREAREYLISRGITPIWWERFLIGYAPDGFDLITPLFKKGFTREDLLSSGIFYEKNGSYVLRFRNRVTIPIWDTSGKVVAFGARVVGEGEPKYLNSPETSIFQKRKILYPFHLAREAVRKKDRILLVEGYMDAISLHIHGYQESMATLGTSFTEDQAKRIVRLTKNIFLLYDGDEAGKKAALRASKIFYAIGVEPKIVLLPEGEDPDSFVRKGGDLESYLERALFPVDIIISEAEREGMLKSSLGKAKVVEKALELLDDVKDEVVIESFCYHLADKVGISFSSVMSKVESKRALRKRVADSESEKKEILWEREFMKFLLRDNSLFESLKGELSRVKFEDDLVDAIRHKLLSSGSLHEAIDLFNNEELQFVGNALFSENFKPMYDIETLMSKFRKRLLLSEVESLKKALLEEKDKEKLRFLHKEYLEKLKMLAGGGR